METVFVLDATLKCMKNLKPALLVFREPPWGDREQKSFTYSIG
jgi:hypothetical protein